MTCAPSASPATAEATLLDRYRAVRRASMRIVEPLETEDFCIQSMPDVSPAKWHLAHATWFFEQFVLEAFVEGYAPHHPAYSVLFNSYYNAIGPQHCRVRRGVLSRPTVAEVLDYRRVIDGRVAALLEERPGDAELARVMTLGLHHEQQHQELMVTDLKHVFSSNPLLPRYHPASRAVPRRGDADEREAATWLDFNGGVTHLGVDASDDPGYDAFTFDNESPRHRVFLEPYRLAVAPVTNARYAGFIADGGYARPELWLSMGWATVQAEGWRQPLYWFREDDAAPWQDFTLFGPQPLNPAEPVCHLSYFEADAFARWSGARLPTEAEWELAAAQVEDVPGTFADTGGFHPEVVPSADRAGSPGRYVAASLFGNTWEWTASSYAPYPGYAPPAGALGEYNGKFMCNQYVLRGGSCATPAAHARLSYRNFFGPATRWQFSGVRLAQST